MKKIIILLVILAHAYTITVQKNNQQLGKQTIIEFFGCDENILDNIKQIEIMMLKAAEAAHATIITHKFHQFSPQGVSGAVILAESHLAIHTWPEYNYCHVDLFTCGDHTDNNAALRVIERSIQATSYKTKNIATSGLEKIINKQ